MDSLNKMLKENIKDIKISDIEQLISQSVVENKTIEYKQNLPENSDTDKKEFLADVSAFANTNGGYLIYGVSESSGKPTDILPIKSTDQDAEIRRLESILQSGIEPRISCEIRSIEHEDGFLYLIGVKQSWNIPHRVIFKGYDKFYARNSAGKYPLDIDELRNLFTLPMTINEKIEKRISERRRYLNSNSLPIKQDNKPKLSLHLIPEESYRNRNYPEIFSIKNDPLIMPMSYFGSNLKINLDGFMTYSVSRELGTFSYTQMYRDAMIEALRTEIVDEEDGSLYYKEVEKSLIEAISRYMEVYKKLGIGAPIVGYISFYKMNKTKLIHPMQISRSTRGIDIDEIYLPDFLIEDYETEIGKIIKPSLDVFWNAFGFEEDPNIDRDGKSTQ